MNGSLKLILGSGSGVVALALAIGGPLTNHATTQPETVASSTEESDGVSEGIQVHGHWVIEVRNPDGTLATRREFENDLEQPNGAFFLMELLATRATAGNWKVYLGGPSDGPCDANRKCVVVQPGDSDLPHFFPTLIVTSVAENLVLSGSAIASADGDISEVATGLVKCDSSVAPTDCFTQGNAPAFTRTTLPSPVPVTAGQQIQVSVMISFS
jgi:hypothetical protein